MPLTLEDIYNQGNSWIQEILTSNGANFGNDEVTNLLNAARLVREGGLLDQEDSLLIDNPSMDQLLRLNTIQLAKKIINRDSVPSQQVPNFPTIPDNVSSELDIYSLPEDQNNIYLCGSKTYSLKKEIKSIPNSYWDRTVGCWKFPLTSLTEVQNLVNKHYTNRQPAAAGNPDLVVMTDIFAMTDFKYQEYYRSDYFLPYVGFRFLVNKNRSYFSTGVYDNYVVLSVGNKIGKLVKEATVSECSMDGLTLIGEPKLIKFDTKDKAWHWADISGKKNKLRMEKGIASDEGLIVSSYNDPLMKYVTNYEVNYKNIPVPKINLVVTVTKVYYNSSFTQKYYISKIAGDQITLKVIPPSVPNLLIENKLVLNKTANGWEVVYNPATERHRDQFYEFIVKFGVFEQPSYGYPK